MSRTAVLNATGVLAALALSMLAVGGGAVAPPDTASGDTLGEAPARIASASTVADRLLFDLCPPERIVAVTALSAEGPEAHRFRDRQTIRSLDDVEAIVSLQPDVFLVGRVGAPRRVERIRQAGVRVVEITAGQGIASLTHDIRSVATLCGVPDGGAGYAAAFERRMGRVSADVPEGARRRGLYVSPYGDRYFGGTVGSSYHDVLTAAGLEDAAAERYRGWPQYGVEQILALDPPVVVTRTGMRRAICEHPALSRLRACADGVVVEIDGTLLDDPGPGMLDAAEAIHDAVYAD